MTREQFLKASELLEQSELEKVRLLAYFYLKTDALREFGMEEIRTWFAELNFHAPNFTRLKKRMEESRSFIRVAGSQKWRLHAADLDELQSRLPGVGSKSEDVVASECILPAPLYESTRGFIELLAKQINASFDYNIYDGCAVLMRRLLEVLLILSYEHLQIEKDIQDANGHYLPLERIVANAKANPKLRLSRDTKPMLEEFRSVGNFSAHKIYFNCRRSDLQRLISGYRAVVEELLYKAGIRK